MADQLPLNLDTLSTMSSLAISSAAAAATTTYPFTYTTYTNASPSPFTKPSEMPTIFPFGSAIACSASASATASAQPSEIPLQHPQGQQAACVISNAAEVNDHAFWDLYACCRGGNMTAFGGTTLCTAQCTPGEGQTWQELGECLNKRVKAVVCKPNANEIGSSASTAPTHSATKSVGASGSAASGTGVATSSSTGAASAVGIVHSTSSKTGIALFALLALGSAAGMFL